MEIISDHGNVSYCLKISVEGHTSQAFFCLGDMKMVKNC